MDLQSVGLCRYPERLLPSQSCRIIGGAVGSHILPSDCHCAAPADYARTRFLDSATTSTRTHNARKPAPSIRPVGHREDCYCAAPALRWPPNWLVRKMCKVRLWYQKLSADSFLHQSVMSASCAVTAEVASSSLVVPAIHSHASYLRGVCARRKSCLLGNSLLRIQCYTFAEERRDPLWKA
jgi:hypothetical protein